MRALVSQASGGPETLVVGTLPEPTAGAGELLLAVHAAAVNFPDTLIIEDKYQIRPPRPFAPGGEVAGVVLAVGEGVTGWAPGDRAFGLTTSGGMAERVALPAINVFHLPDGRSFVEGAALVFTYGTVMHALIDRGRIAAGDTLLVLGAAGGIGLAAIEIGKLLGARVVAAVSSEEKAAAARKAGADETLIYPHGPFDKAQSKALAEQFKAACGKDGANVVLDPVGGGYAEPALRAIAWEGRYLVVGFPAGIPLLPLNLTLLKSCDVCGVFWGAFAARDPAANKVHVDRLIGWWNEDRIAPVVSEVFPLARGGEAIARLAARGAIGKLVIDVTA
ncbi:MAG: NADPH:quinone oxidoreductase [Sphingomonas bacterium]|jgi:NADPH2:quinone reductase|nr:NADPH:quinone oxidoreductase [Sphingomonas bacterium]